MRVYQLYFEISHDSRNFEVLFQQSFGVTYLYEITRQKKEKIFEMQYVCDTLAKAILFIDLFCRLSPQKKEKNDA